MTISSTSVPTARELIAHFGGPTNLVRLGTHHRIDPCPNVEQAKKWSQRNSMPHDYALALVGLGTIIEKPVDLLDTTHHGEPA